ncbi:MAG: T9SS type B sorting domain-containing protein [Bacteroidia bacterium]|nr:T9SS type B sorting domain-containing protein [Bacteroidia bacterium]
MLFLCTQFSIGQKISVDNNLSAQDLIEQYLVQGCVEVSNINSPINGSVNGFSSFGYFERDLSNFPFENGIMLTTGNANSGGNTTNDNILNDGELNWGTDPDLETALGISNTYNATTIEFDFTSISNLIQFNYILASEEYFGNFPCDYSDGFAFLIRQSGTSDPYTNIALIPGTSIPVNTNTIHDEIVGFCPAENDSFFDGYSLGDTNYNGRTVVLSASANIIPNVQYHIKLIIADQTDENYDSAVFIQGNSFNPTVDLGNDITTCAENYTIDGDIQNPLAIYAWYRNGLLLPAETNPQLIADSSGNYEVVITIPLSNEDCIIQDDVSITLNSEQAADTLADYELCDDISGDEIETFDLSTKDAEALSVVPPANYAISYHYSLSDAENDLNPILGPIQNSTNPQTIIVRIEDLDNGCLAFTSFNLVVNPLPIINNLGDIQLCDDELADGSTLIELTDFDDNFTSGNLNLIVSYHYTQADAQTGDNPIPSPYMNSLPNETIYVRVTNTITGCINTTSFTLEILENPEFDAQSLPALNACESDDDGFGFFDLTEVLPDILASLTDVTVTFHQFQQDAENGTNVIANETNYENVTAGVQTIYIRIESDVTGCFTVVPLELHANLLQTGVNTDDIHVCDDESGDGIETFDLQDIADIIGNDIENLVVSFYETEDDLNNQINEIDQSIPYTVNSSPHLLFIHLALPTCEMDGQITLVIDPPVVLNDPETIDYCDTDSDGFTAIDLGTLDDVITSGTPDLTVFYYLNEADAIADQNSLPGSYTNTANPTILYARAQNDLSGCFDTTPIEINVIPAPMTTQPQALIICDNDQDGFSMINLNDFIPQMVSDTTDLNIVFFTAEADAIADLNSIVDPVNYNAETQLIYSRIESVITSCYALVEIEIIVNTLPEFIPISNFQNCETDGNQTAEFLFSEKDDEILNGQTAKEVYYFETQADAINRTNIIDKNTLYTNLSSPQTIFVRVENITDSDCYGFSSFDLEVGSIPIFTPPTNYIVCDDISNDGFETFDLNDKIIEINSGTPETLELSFHTSFDDAENAENQIDLIYTNVENPQQIYVRIENGTYCHAIAEFGLNVVQVPTVNLPSAIENCDSDYDGSTTFDLTVSEFEILDVRDDDIIISYFESVDDLEQDINAITSPVSYQNIENPQTVYVRVLNSVSGCYAVLPLELLVNLPPLVNDLPQIEICENENFEFNLDSATAVLVNNPSGLDINYYTTQPDAENETNALGVVYNYSSINDVLFIRVNDADTGCFRIKEFNLLVNPNPIANTPPDLIDCDDDYDFELEFNLDQQSPIILGAQNANDYTVSYYELESDANTASNAIDNDYLAYDGQTIFARVENNDTGCYDLTSFGITVNRKPNVAIEDQVICLDNLPLVVSADTGIDTDSYSWSTGSSETEITIENIGSYSVTVTSIDGCITISSFSVIESEQATIEITETVDFSDPNNITITISGIGNYLYILDDGEPQESNVFENVSLGYHTLTVIDLNGCASVTTEVLVIDAPKFMTPNSDGYFDTWHIVGIETLPGTTINIFDRYGKLLAFLSSSSEGWDGKYNGQMMPANDYWYVADVVQGNQRFQIKGHFALRR